MYAAHPGEEPDPNRSGVGELLRSKISFPLCRGAPRNYSEVLSAQRALQGYIRGTCLSALEDLENPSYKAFQLPYNELIYEAFVFKVDYLRETEWSFQPASPVVS